MFKQDFTCPVLLVFIEYALSCTGLSPTMAGLSRTAPLKHNRLKGWSPFARRYLGNLNWFLFLRVLRCFTSPRSPHTPMYSVYDTRLKAGGFPHSDISGSKVHCHLPEAFRRLSRLSSPLTAKASTVCTLSLDYITQNSLSISLHQSLNYLSYIMTFINLMDFTKLMFHLITPYQVRLIQFSYSDTYWLFINITYTRLRG